MSNNAVTVYSYKDKSTNTRKEDKNLHKILMNLLRIAKFNALHKS